MREQSSGVTEALARIPDVTIEYVDLLSGDYVIGEGMAVERKAATDFVTSIMSNHLFGQVEQLKVEYEKPFLLIEGDVYNTRSAIPEAALDGAMSYLSVLSGIQLIYTRNANHTAVMLHRMAIHAQNGLGYDVSLRSAKPKDLTPLGLFLIEGLPGIGATSSRVLLNHFKTPHAVFNATPEQMKEVKGIGPKTIERIIDVLHMRK